jgi:hypothetical protein
MVPFLLVVRRFVRRFEQLMVKKHTACNFIEAGLEMAK